MKKVVERKDVSKFVRPDGIEIAIPVEKRSDEIHDSRYLPAGVTSEEADEIDPWAETADANDLQILRDAIAGHPNELHAGEKKLVGPRIGKVERLPYRYLFLRHGNQIRKRLVWRN